MLLAGRERREHVMLGNNCTQLRRAGALRGRPGEERKMLLEGRQQPEQKGL